MVLLPGGTLGGERDASEPFQGQRASFVAAAAIGTLAVALLNSLWEPDISSGVALLGIMAVYMCSTELLLLYFVFAPASVLVDFARVSRVGYGVLSVVLLLAGIACKLAGSVYAYSIHHTVTAGTSYSAVSNGGGLTRGASGAAPAAAAYASDPFAVYNPPHVAAVHGTTPYPSSATHHDSVVPTSTTHTLV